MLKLPHAPATARNREAIFEILNDQLKHRKSILEIASGTGEHAAWMAPKLPINCWQPSDKSLDSLHIIDSYNQQNDMVLPAIQLDVCKNWPARRYQMLICINMIHISPWEACLALLQNSTAHLQADGLVYLYGPYKVNNQHTAQSNAQFDASLRRQNPTWGVRNMDTVIEEATNRGLRWVESIPMPANNYSIIFTCSP